MKFLSAVLAIVTLTASAIAAGEVSPFTWTFGGTPVAAPVTAIDPPKGAVVIDSTTGIRYRKIGAKGSNAAANYAVEIPTLVTAVTPLTGATVTASALLANETIYITPAGTLATLTVSWPSNANSSIGQRFAFFSTQTITALTVSSPSQTLVGTALTAMVANTEYAWVKTAASVWIRVK